MDVRRFNPRVMDKIIYLPNYSDAELHSGFYVYMLCYPDKKPFYIGKGKTPYRREMIHFPYYMGGMSEDAKKLKIINSIWQKKQPVFILLPYIHLTEKEALSLEGKLINFYGLVRDNSGSLVNVQRPKKHIIGGLWYNNRLHSRKIAQQTTLFDIRLMSTKKKTTPSHHVGCKKSRNPIDRYTPKKNNSAQWT